MWEKDRRRESILNRHAECRARHGLHLTTWAKIKSGTLHQQSHSGAPRCFWKTFYRCKLHLPGEADKRVQMLESDWGTNPIWPTFSFMAFVKLPNLFEPSPQPLPSGVSVPSPGGQQEPNTCSMLREGMFPSFLRLCFSQLHPYSETRLNQNQTPNSPPASSTFCSNFTTYLFLVC